MKERPILFSAQMVRAILDGRKTQTRRIVNKPIPVGHKFHGWIIESTDKKRDGCAAWSIGDDALAYDLIVAKCKYGKPGDRLWVRETWHTIFDNELFDGEKFGKQKSACIADNQGFMPVCKDGIVYRADVPNLIGARWTPSIYMPRWASRILLEVTDVRVEKLQDISEEDAISDGAAQITDEYTGCADDICSHAHAYKFIWESINGQGSWDLNPWVWVVEFRGV